MKKNFITIFSIILTIVLIDGCSGDEASTGHENLFSDAKKVNVKINREIYDNMIQTLPQPIEIASIISSSETEFSKDILIPIKTVGEYHNKYVKAMALGAFGVDLGYLNLQDRSLYVLDYLECIRIISAQLDVDQFFDFFTLAEMAKNKDNIDSMIQISTHNFRRIDEFLRDKQRGELSVLILIGAWIEGMHMFVQIENETQSADIKKRIGEQKIVYNNISLIIDKLIEIEQFKKLKEDLKQLDQAYERVKITYEYQEPEAMEIDGELVFVDKSETTVEISEETLEQINNSIEDVRNKYFVIISNK